MSRAFGIGRATEIASGVFDGRFADALVGSALQRAQCPDDTYEAGGAHADAANSIFVVTTAMKSQPKTYWARRDWSGANSVLVTLNL